MADATDSTTLTARQYNAISALLTEPTIRKAAEVAKVPERTFYRWLKDPLFVAEYRAARREATAQAQARAQQFSSSMVGVMVSIAGDTRKSAAARVTAAKAVVDIAVKSVEIDDLAARLEELERRFAEKL